MLADEIQVFVLLVLLACNLLCLLFFIEVRRSLLATTLSVVFFIADVSPQVFFLFFDFHHPLALLTPSNIFLEASVFVAGFLFMMVMSYSIGLMCFQALGVNFSLPHIQLYDHHIKPIWVILFIYACSVIVTLTLIAQGSYVKLAEQTSGPFVQIGKALSEVNLLATVLYKLQLERQQIRRKEFKLLGGLLAALNFFIAIYSGSRTLFVVTAIIYLILYKNLLFNMRPITILLTSLGAFFGAILFTVIGFFRGFRNDIELAIGVSDIMVDLIRDQGIAYFLIPAVKRLNYYDPVAKVIENYPDGSGLTELYLQNFVGLVPRLLWPGKPIIGYDSQSLAHDLGYVSLLDQTTSVGVGYIGEAFYVFGWKGVWIACAFGLFFASVDRLLDVNEVVTRSIYIYFSVIVAFQFSYFSALPGFVMALGVSFAVASLIHRKVEVA